MLLPASRARLEVGTLVLCRGEGGAASSFDRALVRTGRGSGSFRGVRTGEACRTGETVEGEAVAGEGEEMVEARFSGEGGRAVLWGREKMVVGADASGGGSGSEGEVCARTGLRGREATIWKIVGLSGAFALEGAGSNGRGEDGRLRENGDEGSKMPFVGEGGVGRVLVEVGASKRSLAGEGARPTRGTVLALTG